MKLDLSAPPKPRAIRTAAAVKHVCIASNLPVLPERLRDGARLDNRVVLLGRRPLHDALRYFLAGKSRDAVVLHVPDRELLALCALRKLLPWRQARLVAVDLILTKPGRSFRQRLLAWIKGWLLRQVDLFLLHQKDVSGLEAAYGINVKKVRYIPYKVNSWHAVREMDVPEGDYVFSGGRSRRDYDTFCAALHDLPLPTLLLTPRREVNALHETDFDGKGVPDHVRVVHDDGSPRSWLRHMANARIVVIPVLRNSISPSGVGTYLLAMALGKCVVMSESPATRGVIEHEKQAVLVPMGDAAALREAVRRVWFDDDYRDRIAANGYAYAMSLGGVENLQRNIAEAVADHLLSREPQRDGATT